MLKQKRCPLLDRRNFEQSAKQQSWSDLLCLVYRVLDLLLVKLFLRSIQWDQLDR